MSTQTELRVYGSDGPVLNPDGFAPAGVRGADKVAQRFVYFLLTPGGSVPGRPSDGSPFLELARAFRSEFDVYAAFAAAYAVVVSSCRAAEQPGDPATERFGFARISGLSIQARMVIIALDLRNAAGEIPSAPVEFILEV